MFLWLNTYRYKRPVQFLNRVTRCVPRPLRATNPAPRPRDGRWTRSIEFQPEPLKEPSLLRDYTRHYHHGHSAEQVTGWIAANPPAAGRAWEPYPLSLRTVNWIRWILSGAEGTPPARPILDSLAMQAARLSATVEYHLLANHLFVNGKALVFAGAFFEQPAWLNQGLRILDSEIPEQILADGGHFERSPMYHSLILEDLLDLVNLSGTYPGLIPDWSEPAGRMLSWLRQMIHPDGRISFFNDATFGGAPEPSAIFAYAERLGVEPAANAQLSDSGYIRLENARTVVLFDAAPIGPDYQPAHAHCDTLSFELSHRGGRLLVNSGTSTYERGPQRSFERSTAAHNTVRVDGEDQSETWAAFRVARRARPFDVMTDHQTFAEAAHTGYHRLKPPVTHRRRLELHPDHLEVRDTLEGTGTHSIEIYFHHHPDTSVEISLDPRFASTVERTTWRPGFEKSVPNRTQIGRISARLPVTFETRINLG